PPWLRSLHAGAESPERGLPRRVDRTEADCHRQHHGLLRGRRWQAGRAPRMSELTASDALSLATEAAREAGALLLELHRSPATGIRSKSSATDLVSDADDRAERAIVRRMRRLRPDASLVAEEGSSAGGSSGVSWFVDPLDGTINY